LTSNVNGDIPLSEVKELVEDDNNRHYIADMTLEQLRQYNFGYYFENELGERIYKDVTDIESAGLQIATVDQLFDEFYESHPDLLFIAEIKNSGDLGYRVCEILNETLNKYPIYKNRIIIGSFHDEIEREIKTKYPHLLRGASTGSAVKFILTQFLFINAFDDGDFACLQIPTSYDVGIEVSLISSSIVDRAHARNMAVQYWTVNDADLMRTLIELGCDGITTDDPVLLKQVLMEYK
jgi:glycerophosphoryl diester phosphodiesterase